YTTPRDTIQGLVQWRQGCQFLQLLQNAPRHQFGAAKAATPVDDPVADGSNSPSPIKPCYQLEQCRCVLLRVLVARPELIQKRFTSLVGDRRLRATAICDLPA